MSVKFTLKSKKTREVNAETGQVGNLYFDFICYHDHADKGIVEFLYYYYPTDSEVKTQMGGTSTIKNLSLQEIAYLESLTTPTTEGYRAINLEFYINGAFAILEQEKKFGWTSADWEIVND